MSAYDLQILPRLARRGNGGDHGWCFGRPPGIAVHEWPLDPVAGWPLKHGFTLLLPDEHRVHGPDLVALAFFAPAPEHAARPPRPDPALVAAVLGESRRPPGDPHLLPFWTAGRRAHPRLARLRDDRGLAYAAILLTRAEFDGPFCPPPDLPASPYLAHTPRPRWLDTAVGLATDAVALAETAGPAGSTPIEPEPLHHHAVRAAATAIPSAANHIGGASAHAAPTIGPHHLGFDEDFGGLGLDGARGLLDLETMRFDRLAL